MFKMFAGQCARSTCMFNYGATAVLKLCVRRCLEVNYVNLKLKYVVVLAVMLEMFAGQCRGSTCMVVELLQF